MRNIYSIFKREFCSYFATPIALIFLCVFLMLNGFFTFKFGNFFQRGQADLEAFFMWHPWLYLFIVPAVSMRIWAEERGRGTIELLLTLPVSIFQAMLGKFLAAWVFLGIALLLTFPMVITVCYLGDPDVGVILAAYIGSFLMAGSFLAIGCFLSSVTNNQIISFVLTSSVCLFLILIGFEPVIQLLRAVAPEALVNQLVSLSFPFHFSSIQTGVLDLRDVVYFISIMLYGLFSGVVCIDRFKAD